MTRTIPTLFIFLTILALCAATAPAGGGAGEGSAQRSEMAIPVTSQMIDVADDPESDYAGAPRFDWAFFGGRMRLIAKWGPVMPAYRHVLGIDPGFNLIETRAFTYPPPPWMAGPLDDKPPIPTIIFAKVGKINHLEDSNERAKTHDIEEINRFIAHYPNAIFGGGEIAEVDSIFNWQFNDYFGRLPVGPRGASFPAAYFDFLESNLRRGAVPYMLQQHNRAWGTHYVARERIMSLSSAQLFYRGNQVIVPSLVTLRSAARQYPFPYGVQFSGQPSVSVANEAEVLEKGAKPIFERAVGRLGENYSKSYALCRQVLYLSWLNGARFFNWETGDFVRAKNKLIPTPLGTFTARADAFIKRTGPSGPVQTPIALISEFSNAWRPPFTVRNHTIDFTINGDAPYAPGDYQAHGIRDLFMRHYLQSEWIYENSMGEDHALCATPYGESVDLLLSDVRAEALARYGLLIWIGVPPAVPSMIRDKILGHVINNRGRAVLFGATARITFPEWFSQAPPRKVAPGAQVTCGGSAFTETAGFTMQTLDDAALQKMTVLATVNNTPLIVECLGGLVLVLSDYGLNDAATVNPAKAQWKPGELITQIPYGLLEHARRILDTEARRQTLFTVSNDNLHYIVTRPKPGQYLVGIFNDGMKSEPFKITSAIGTIATIRELTLDDHHAELKSVAGGVPYSPPGLRDSPDLPLDYGLSDASHIEGRDVRIFQVSVEERGVREIPAIKYPRRPSGRVLAVPGLEYARRHLQGISTFHSWFDGIKADAGSVLSTEDSCLAEQAHYLDRRGVRVVVDATGVDAAGLIRVIDKLKALRKAPKDLIVKAPPTDVGAAAQRGGVRLVAPERVKRLTAPGHRFDDTATLNVVDLHYANEDDLYRDLKRFTTGDKSGELLGRNPPTELCPSPKHQDGLAEIGPHVSDLTALLSGRSKEFAGLKSVRIDSAYLLSKTTEALARDAATLKVLKLAIVVDLRRDQVFFDRIAFYPHLPNYEKGLKLYDEVLRKMAIIGSTDLVLRVNDIYDTKSDPKYIGLRDRTMGAFTKSAAERGINLHLACDARLRFSDPSYLDGPNVFVITGPKGKKASPYRP